MEILGRAIVSACIFPALLAVAPTPADAGESAEGLDEVVVEGSRNELNRLRAKVVELEDGFYERFNELNTIDDFDTHCHSEARIGTKLKRRYCRAVFQDKAYRSEGQGYTEYLQRTIATDSPPQPTGLILGPPPPAYVAIQERMDDYRENMRQVVRRHPELLELVRKRYEAERNYDAARRRIFGLAPAEEPPPTQP